jgi:hypothetical protein
MEKFRIFLMESPIIADSPGSVKSPGLPAYGGP